MDNTNNNIFFVPNITNKGVTMIHLSDFSQLYTYYESADILIVDDDPIIRTLISRKLGKYKIKKDSVDLGRDIIIQTCKNPNEFLELISDNNTYALILIDENLGPENLTGSQCIKRARDSEYKGVIISISGDSCNTKLISILKDYGSNGLIRKDSVYFFNEISNILGQLTRREIINTKVNILVY